MLFPRASLKRSSRTRTRKNTSVDMDIECPSDSPCSSIAVHRKTRPPPLQIIPELSESGLSIDGINSLATARPKQFIPRQPELVSSRITLSAYTFSIDDALLVLGGEVPRSPALSASSSTSDGASSEDVPATPGTSDDEDGYDFSLPTPRIRLQRVSIHPLCVTKTRSLVCQEDEDIHYLDKEERAVTLPAEEMFQRPTEATEAADESEQDFYTRELEDFISLFSALPSPTSPARRDSLILIAEALPAAIQVPEPKPRGRSRHSKPLPLLPPATPPASSYPPIPALPLVQMTARRSIVRRKRNISSVSNHPLVSPAVSRPLPRTTVPLDIEDCISPEANLDIPSCEQITIEEAHDVEEDATIYSQSSFTHMVPPATVSPPPPAIPETPLSGMYGEASLPRSSTDSGAPRSSVDSTSSSASSTSSNTPITPFSFPSSPNSEERLRSRWSTSTLGSVVEPPRTIALFSPLRNVFGPRARAVPLSLQKSPPRLTPSKHPKNKHDPTTPSPPRARGKHARQGSQSSTSSAGTSASECDSHDGSPSGLKRKPIHVAMFLRSNS